LPDRRSNLERVAQIEEKHAEHDERVHVERALMLQEAIEAVPNAYEAEFAPGPAIKFSTNSNCERTKELAGTARIFKRRDGRFELVNAVAFETNTYAISSPRSENSAPISSAGEAKSRT
jgi:hypothetical protein